MKLQKFENVDVIASLEAIMKQNTAFYQSDFDIDKQILQKAAVSPVPEDKRLLWFSRPSGTCCFRERDVFLKDTRQHNTWRFYGEQTRDTILAYAVELTGTEQGKIKQCTFQKFCKSVLHNEACNAHEEIRRRRVREVTFSDLALYEERQLYTVDKYFQDEEAEPSYQMAGKEITPKLLLEAIRALPEERRKIVLLYYFEGLTDIEIAKQLNISRSTVQYRRTSSFEQLKKYLEENADEWIEW